MLKEREIQRIRYTKINDNSGTMDRFEEAERVIIPTFVPKQNYKAVDVTDLSDEQRNDIQQKLTEYNKYVLEQSKSVFKFEDWVNHTMNEEVSVKWRTFKVEHTELL
jgi:DNA/RNA endonuclease YhcR with UshA esterase domain